MADREARSETVHRIYTYTAHDDDEQPSALPEFLSYGAPFLTVARTGSTVEATEPSQMAAVDAAPQDATMTVPVFSKSDWYKLAVAATGSAVIGAGVLLSPLVPIGAIAIGAVAVTIAGLRGARH